MLKKNNVFQLNPKEKIKKEKKKKMLQHIYAHVKQKSLKKKKNAGNFFQKVLLTFLSYFLSSLRKLYFGGVGEKTCGPTKISPLFHHQPNKHKHHFSLLFSHSFSILPMITPTKRSLSVIIQIQFG